MHMCIHAVHGHGMEQKMRKTHGVHENLRNRKIFNYGIRGPEAKVHTYIHAYKHTYMHTYIHTYIHTYMLI